MWHEKFAELLKEDLEQLKKKNPRFSFRAYAKRLKVSPGSLHDFLHKQRHSVFSKETALELLDRLTLDEIHRMRFLAQVGKTPEIQRSTLSPTAQQLFRNPSTLQVLFSFDLPASEHRPDRIAARIGADEETVRRIIQQLRDRDLLAPDASGQLRRTQRYFTSSDGITSDDIRAFHRANLQLAEAALERLPVTERDFTALTFAGTAEQMEELKREIRALHDKAEALMSGEGKRAVYRLSIQLFPV